MREQPREFRFYLDEDGEFTHYQSACVTCIFEVDLLKRVNDIIAFTSYDEGADKVAAAWCGYEWEPRVWK